MCRPSKCATCSGATWYGRCGLHIEQVMEAVPVEEWCKCPKLQGSKYPPIGIALPPRESNNDRNDAPEVKATQQ